MATQNREGIMNSNKRKAYYNRVYAPETREDKVYFILANETLVKIGYTQRPIEQRLHEIQTQCPFGCTHDARVIRIIPGNRQVEAYFLSYFEHVRKVLDWYIFSPEMLTILPPGNGLDSFIQE